MHSRAQIHNLTLARQAARPVPGRKVIKAARRALILAACVLLLFLGHALFTVKEIRVAGAVHFDPGAVTALSGIETGSSIFLVSTQKAARRLQADPSILSVEVSKEYPSAITITIGCRTPAAYILTQGGCWTVDEVGIVFEQAGEIGGSLPVITGVDPEILILGSPLQEPARAEALKAFVRALAAVPDLAPSELNLEDSNEMVLYTAAGVKVLLGDSRNMAHKLALLRETLPYLPEASSGSCLDIRTGDRLVVLEKR